MSNANTKSTDMKRRLLDAAEIVFNDKGYQGARVSDIVGQAGAAQGSFYLHFENKRAVYLELIDGFFSHLMDETLGQYPAAQIKMPADMRALYLLSSSSGALQRDESEEHGAETDDASEEEEPGQ